MIIQELQKQGVAHPPAWLPTNCHYLTIMGSQAYGVAREDSDNDIYGFAIPPLDDVFPNLRGEILGFGRQKKRFEQWEEAHLKRTDNGKEYDFQVYSIVKYFSLCMENNPNMIDSLFTPVNCVIHSTAIGNLVRDNRRMFLHKGCWPKFKGYAYGQMTKMSNKNPKEGSKRHADVMEHGYDTKFAYHVVRMMDEVEQILTTGDLDLQRSREVLKAIRRGDWTEEQIRQYFTDKEKQLEQAYVDSALPWGPDEAAIKNLLLQCLEHHYGSLDKAFVLPDRYETALRHISEICHKAGIQI